MTFLQKPGPVMYETNIKKHVRMLRNHRLLILASVVLRAAAAAAYAWTREDQYSAHTQLYVSATAAGTSAPPRCTRAASPPSRGPRPTRP